MQPQSPQGHPGALHHRVGATGMPGTGDGHRTRRQGEEGQKATLLLVSFALLKDMCNILALICLLLKPQHRVINGNFYLSSLYCIYCYQLCSIILVSVGVEDVFP